MTTSKRRRQGPECPVCGKASAGPARDDATKSPFPFCSARCRTIDLGHWLDERYRLEDALGRFEDAQD